MQGIRAAGLGTAGRRTPCGCRLRRGRCLHRPPRRAWRMAGVCALLPARSGFVGRAISPAAGAWHHRRVSGTMRASSPTGAGQGPAGPCRIFLPLTGNAPLRLRLPAHPPPLAGEALEGTAAYKASPVRGCGVERRLRRRKLFLMRQTAVTPFIIACSAIESIGPPFAHRSGLCRFAATPRSQNASMLQHAPHDAGTANR